MAQKRTEFAVKDLAKQVGGLSNAFGASLEDFACDLVPEILEKHWRLVVVSAQPEEIETGLGQHEMDLVVRGTIDGRPVVVVCEVISPQTLAEARQRGLRVPTNKSGCALFLRSGEDLDTLGQ